MQYSKAWEASATYHQLVDGGLAPILRDISLRWGLKKRPVHGGNVKAARAP